MYFIHGFATYEIYIFSTSLENKKIKAIFNKKFEYPLCMKQAFYFLKSIIQESCL